MKSTLLSLILIFSFALTSCSKKEDTQKPPENSRDTGVGNPFDPDRPDECLAIDTDGDGVIDCEDPDIDGDGVLNEIDAFPYDRYEWLDSDGDGVGDNTDWAPLDPAESMDTDGDTIGNNADEDDDNDGVPDVFEHINFKLDPYEWADNDNDTIGNNADEDDDNDGVPDLWDDLSWNSRAYFDIDNDFQDNTVDLDMDGDGIPNMLDAFPYDPTEWSDTDGDKIGNNVDPDDDNDGFPDSWEDYPLNRTYIFDTDGDGFANEEDAFPYNPNEWLDSDGDGVGDNSDPFPFNATEWADTDGDGIGDNADPDIDNDGFPNCVPYLQPNLDPTYPACDRDKFPLDRFESEDTDNDLIGDNTDEDDDNDGIPDMFDAFPKDARHFSDNDKDRIPDSYFPISQAERDFLGMVEGQVFFVLDGDIDNDGVPNLWDDLPVDAFEFFDIDSDKIGAKQDTDIDGDGVPNHLDRFPWDSTEWADNDNDGIGDNADEDDDNDGVPDLWDDLKFNRLGFTDINLDNMPDQQSNDADGDGFTNGSYTCGIVYPMWQESFFDANNDGTLDAACIASGQIIPRWYSGVPSEPNSTLINCMNNANSYQTQQSCFTNSAFNDIEYKACLASSTPNSTCESNYNTLKNRCSTFAVRICKYEDYSTNGSTGRNDLYPFDPFEWKDNDNDGVPDNKFDADDDNDGVPDLWDDFPNDKPLENRYRWFDSDKDGLPNMVYYLDNNANSFKYEYGNAGLSGIIADNDSDNDGVDQGKLVCTRVSDNKVVGPDHYRVTMEDLSTDPECGTLGWEFNEDTNQCEPSPELEFIVVVDGTTDTINCFYEKSFGLDYFPFNENESVDTDGDKIGDNKDTDIDNDRKNNCTIANSSLFKDRFDFRQGKLAGDPTNTLHDITSFVSVGINNKGYRFAISRDCEEDELPYVSNLDPFVTAIFQPLDSPIGYDTVAYCANQADCYFKNYDRDGDGLTDYEEYLFGSNPMKADTDGDGVSDFYERWEGTDPNNKNSFLDDDGDSIPNSLDPFPQGAYDKNSLLDQVTKSSSCITRTESSCEDPNTVSLNYCQLVEDPTVMFDDGNGGFFYGTKCSPKPVIITKDIIMDDCLTLTGEVIIEAKNNAKIIARDFSNGVRCNPVAEDRALITALENSDLTLKDVIIEATDLDTVIKSSGKALTIDRTAITGNHVNFMKTIDYTNTEGLLKITNSTLRSVLKSSGRPTRTTQDPMLIANAKVITLRSSLIDCNYTNKGIEETSDGTGVYFLDNFSCVDTKSNEAMIEKNIITMNGEDIDEDSIVANAVAMKHESTISTVFADINNISSGMEGLILSGSGYNINVNNLYIKDRLNRTQGATPIGVYTLNNTTVNVKEAGIDYTKMFSSPTSGVLYCKNQSSDVLPTYFSTASPLTIPMTVSAFTNTPNNIIGAQGLFTGNSILDNYWNVDNPYYLNPEAFDGDNQRVRLLAGTGQPEGLSYKVQGLTVGKKYRFVMNIDAASTAKLNINLNLLLADTATSGVLEQVNVVLEDFPEQERIAYDELTKSYKYRSNFINSNVVFVFKAKKTSMYLRLFNGYPSEHVYINRVQLFDSTNYNTNILGAPIPVCKEDESHLVK